MKPRNAQIEVPSDTNKSWKSKEKRTPDETASFWCSFMKRVTMVVDTKEVDPNWNGEKPTSISPSDP